MNRLFLSAAALALFSTAAQAKVIWRGDYETGDLSQWEGHEITAPDRLQVVQSPVNQGRFALQATVKQGDNPISSSGNRNELFSELDHPRDGEERYYHWSTMWPDSFQSADTWQLFTQWHQYDGGGSPPVEFVTRGERISLNLSSQEVWNAPLERGRWHDFVVHMKWSADPKQGFAEVWYDGALALPMTHGATLANSNDTVYIKQGLYRDAKVTQTQTIFHDGMTIATTLDDVMPPASVAKSTTTATSSGSAGGTLEQSNDRASAQAGCSSVSPTSLLGLLFAVPMLWKRRRTSKR